MIRAPVRRVADVVANGQRFHVQRLAAEGLEAGGQQARGRVVFLHGLVIDNLSSFYYTLAGPVAQAGFESVLYDLRGHGMSARPVTGYTMADAVADLDAVLDALEIDEPVFLLGNSYGGMLAVHAALARPDWVAGLVLVEAHAGLQASTWIEDMANTLTVAALGLEHDRTHEQLSATGRRKLARMAHNANELLNRTSLIDDLAALPPIGPAALAAIECPVLAVYGESSELVGAAADLARFVPRCTVRVFPGLAHTVLTEATAELRDTVLDWLGQHVALASQSVVTTGS